MRGHKRDKQVQMTWITRLELHCDAVTSGVPILHSTQISDTDTRRGDTGYMIQISHTYKIIIRIIIMVFMINIITSLHYIALKKGWYM